MDIHQNPCDYWISVIIAEAQLFSFQDFLISAYANLSKRSVDSAPFCHTFFFLLRCVRHPRYNTGGLVVLSKGIAVKRDLWFGRATRQHNKFAAMIAVPIRDSQPLRCA